MAKEKFDDFRKIEIVGELDNQDGEYVIYVDGEAHELMPLIEQMCGYQIMLKCEMQ